MEIDRTLSDQSTDSITPPSSSTIARRSIGQVVVVRMDANSFRTCLCTDVRPTCLQVTFAEGGPNSSLLLPHTALIEIIGSLPQSAQSKRALFDLVQNANGRRTTISVHAVTLQCDEEASYSLNEMCEKVGIREDSISDRLAVALFLLEMPSIIEIRRALYTNEGGSLYGLASDWRKILEIDKSRLRPNKRWIDRVIEKHLERVFGLYKSTIDRQTGKVVLSFLFPLTARLAYAEQIAALEKELGVQVEISPATHEGALVLASSECLPPGLVAVRRPSLYREQRAVLLFCSGETSEEERLTACERFHEQTQWTLFLHLVGRRESRGVDSPQRPYPSSNLTYYEAVTLTQALGARLPGFLKVQGDASSSTLTLFFRFPLVVKSRYCEQIAHIATMTGWQVLLSPKTDEHVLEERIRTLLPADLYIYTLHISGTQQVTVTCFDPPYVPSTANQVQERVFTETGHSITFERAGRSTHWTHPPTLGRSEVEDLMRFTLGRDLRGFHFDVPKRMLWLRFWFPDAAKTRLMEHISDIERRSGWKVAISPAISPNQLLRVARTFFAGHFPSEGKFCFDVQQRRLSLLWVGVEEEELPPAAKRNFSEETGWLFEIISSEQQWYAQFVCVRTHKGKSWWKRRTEESCSDGESPTSTRITPACILEEGIAQANGTYLRGQLTGDTEVRVMPDAEDERNSPLLLKGDDLDAVPTGATSPPISKSQQDVENVYDDSPPAENAGSACDKAVQRLPEDVFVQEHFITTEMGRRERGSQTPELLRIPQSRYWVAIEVLGLSPALSDLFAQNHIVTVGQILEMDEDILLTLLDRHWEWALREVYIQLMHYEFFVLS